MMSKEIDPNILRQNIKYLEKLEYTPVVEFDEHESITPTTNKGHLTQESKKFFFKEAIEKLQDLIKSNEEAEFYQRVKGDFENQGNLVNFLQNQGKILEFFVSDRIFIKKYQYKDSKTSEVLRFGINLKDKEVFQELIYYNKDLEKLLDKNPEDAKSNISGATKYKAFCSKYIKIADSENLAIKSAISFLESSSNNIALVDVFKRESKAITDPKNKKIVLTQVGGINLNEIDTHTVLLYKTTNNKMLVIDPNNPMFSSHLSQYIDDVYIIETLCDTDPKYKIYTPQSRDSDIGKTLIEKYTSITGTKHDQYRDCIDIAVKIAFALNNSGNTYQNITEILGSSIMKLITNNPMVDGIVLTDKFPTKLKQVSNFEKVIECNMSLKLYSELLKGKEKVAGAIKEKSIQEIEEKYLSSISIYEQEHETQLLGLEEIYQKYCEESI